MEIQITSMSAKENMETTLHVNDYTFHKPGK